MSDATKTPSSKRILLSGVFGPFGVDDEWGRKENIMELFHNQVTKAQGAASLRFHHRSFGLYFIAANIDADVTVLDFPSRERFIRELKKGYDVVGISFITPNFVRAREMARLIRLHSPASTIVLGGHGTAIEGIDQLIDCDHVARGEGIRWMRGFLGQDQEAPIVHPVLPSSERSSILGVPVPGKPANLLVPGLGCVNGCRFCCTSHFFERTYTPFLATGQELYQTACNIADITGSEEFFVMDENFLKDRERALGLLAEMERNQRYFQFHLFSSAEAITSFGIDNLVRLGVHFLWIGVESSKREGNYEKNQGIDATQLVKDLRDRGITVLASGILCSEHHTQENIQAEIDFMVGLEADMVQFMLLTPLPVTKLYRDMKLSRQLRSDLPFEDWHGQKTLTYHHPEFPGDSADRWMKAAFRKDYEVNSSSIYRVIETAFRGWKRLSSMATRDACLEYRLRQLTTRTRDWSAMLPELARRGVNQVARERALHLDSEICAALGTPGLTGTMRRAAIRVISASWHLRLKLRGDVIQPATLLTHYRSGDGKMRGVRIASAHHPRLAVHLSRAAALATLAPTVLLK